MAANAYTGNDVHGQNIYDIENKCLLCVLLIKKTDRTDA